MYLFHSFHHTTLLQESTKCGFDHCCCCPRKSFQNSKLASNHQQKRTFVHDVDSDICLANFFCTESTLACVYRKSGKTWTERVLPFPRSLLTTSHWLSLIGTSFWPQLANESCHGRVVSLDVYKPNWQC